MISRWLRSSRRRDRRRVFVATTRRPAAGAAALGGGEQSVLGGLLLDKRRGDRIGDLLGEDDFLSLRASAVYGVVATLVNGDQAADVITVFEQLQRLGKGDDCGGLVYPTRCAERAERGQHRRTPRSCARALRASKARPASDEIATSAFNPQGRPCRRSSTTPEGNIFRTARRARAPPALPEHGPARRSSSSPVNELHENGAEEVTGVRTGVLQPRHDYLRPAAGDLIVSPRGRRCSRPRSPPTSPSTSPCTRPCRRRLLMEMCASQLGPAHCRLARPDRPAALRTGALRDDYGAAFGGGREARQVSIFIDESGSLSPTELRARARRQARQYGQLGLIVVDYLQLMSARRHHDENRATVLARSRGR